MNLEKLKQHILEHEFKIGDFLGAEDLHHGTANIVSEDSILMHDGKYQEDPFHFYVSAWECLDLLVRYLNKAREMYILTLDHSYLHQILVLLPRSWKYILKEDTNDKTGAD